MSKQIGLVNRSALKAYLHERIRVKKFGRFTQIAGQTLDHYEAFVSSLLRQWSRNLSASIPACPASKRLLYWPKVQRHALELAQGHWDKIITIKAVSEVVPEFVEAHLKIRIDQDIHSHPSMGKTFQV